MSHRKSTIDEEQLMFSLEEIQKSVPTRDVVICLQMNYAEQLSSLTPNPPTSETKEILLELKQGRRLWRIYSRAERQRAAQCIVFLKIKNQYLNVWYKDGKKLAGPIKLNYRTIKSTWEMLEELEVSHLFRKAHGAIINLSYATRVSSHYVRIGHKLFHLQEDKKDTSINPSL